MSDNLSPKDRSKNMTAIGSKNTKPELIIRRAIHSEGLRYGLHNKNLPGTPDLHFKKFNAVLFVNGCFWHAHDCELFNVPKSNVDYWEAKFARNKKRDQLNIRKLKEMNKRVCIVWECAIKGGNKIALDKIVQIVKKWLNSKSNYFQIPS